MAKQALKTRSSIRDVVLAERLMTEAGARLDKTANRYTFANTVLSLTFARAQTARDGNTQLILTAYAKA